MSRIDMSREFVEALTEATARIEEVYFKLPIAGHPDGVYRERVYCYELYHQLRVISQGSSYVVSGEVDKRAHPILRNTKVRDTVPDLLIHQPGDMGGNLVVVEVKSTNARLREIEQDIQKITLFIREAGYELGILLLFGNDTKTVEAVVQLLHDKQVSEPITLLWHSNARQRAVRLDSDCGPTFGK